MRLFDLAISLGTRSFHAGQRENAMHYFIDEYDALGKARRIGPCAREEREQTFFK